jgi:hypothetical protein
VQAVASFLSSHIVEFQDLGFLLFTALANPCIFGTDAFCQKDNKLKKPRKVARQGYVSSNVQICHQTIFVHVCTLPPPAKITQRHLAKEINRSNIRSNRMSEEVDEGPVPRSQPTLRGLLVCSWTAEATS